MVLGHLNHEPNSVPQPKLQASQCWGGAPRPSEDDVVVVHGRRTAIARAGRGAFKVRPWDPASRGRGPPRSVPRAVASGVGVGAGSRGLGPPCAAGPRSPRPRSPLQDTTPDELLSAVLTAVLQDVKLSPSQLGDICVGEPATRALLGLGPLRRPVPPKLASHASLASRPSAGVFTEGNVTRS